MNENLIQIRKVKPEDAREWNVFVNKVWRDAYHHIFPEDVFLEKESKLEEKNKKFTERMKNDDKNIAYVSEYNGKIIGVMCGSINSVYEHFQPNYADLIGLYIDPNFQGCGICTKFREIFEKWAFENGATQYVIGVLKDNIKAREVYESWGGKLSEYEEDFIKFDIAYPEVFYTFDLQKTINKHM